MCMQGCSRLFPLEEFSHEKTMMFSVAALLAAPAVLFSVLRPLPRLLRTPR